MKKKYKEKSKLKPDECIVEGTFTIPLDIDIESVFGLPGSTPINDMMTAFVESTHTCNFCLKEKTQETWYMVNLKNHHLNICSQCLHISLKGDDNE